MNCLYYLTPTLESTHQVTDDLHAAGVRDFFIHVISKDEHGLGEHHLHSSNYLETLDIVRDGFIGAALGFIAGLIGAALLVFTEPFGPTFPRIIIVFVVAVATLFGAWVGGLTGIASEHKNLRKFRQDLEAGKYLILVYVRKAQGAAVRALMRTKHPESELVAVNTHYINPFKPVRRRHHKASDNGGEQALQKD